MLIKKTVSSVFEKAVVEIKAIQDKQKAESKRLSAKQVKLDADFKKQSHINNTEKETAEKEVLLAGQVIQNFSKLFCIDRKQTK